MPTDPGYTEDDCPTYVPEQRRIAASASNRATWWEEWILTLDGWRRGSRQEGGDSIRPVPRPAGTLLVVRCDTDGQQTRASKLAWRVHDTTSIRAVLRQFGPAPATTFRDEAYATVLRGG